MISKFIENHKLLVVMPIQQRVRENKNVEATWDTQNQKL